MPSTVAEPFLYPRLQHFRAQRTGWTEGDGIDSTIFGEQATTPNQRGEELRHFSGERPFLGVSIQYRRRQPCQGQAVGQDQGETEHQDSRADAALLGAIAESLLRRTKRILPRLDGALPDLHRGRRVRIPRV